jgi:hypothetical protein
VKRAVCEGLLNVQGGKAVENKCANITSLEMGESLAGQQAGARADGCDGSQEIKNVEGWDGTSIGWRSGSSVRADGPVVNVEKRAEELLSKEITVVGLVKVNTVGREDARQIGGCQVKEKTGLRRVQRGPTTKRD